MSARLSWLGLAVLCGVAGVFSCRFEPDLSRFELCAEDGACALGYTCLSEARRCLPDCGEQGPCPLDTPPDPSGDAGTEEDGGTDAGVNPDAGTDAGIPLSWQTEALALAVESQPYRQELKAQGGTAPYVFQATEALPQWLTLAAGTLSGTAPQPGNFRVALEVVDSSTPANRKTAVYNVRVRPLLRVAGPQILADGYQGNSYSEVVSATGGTLPYDFKILSGNPPPGLTLSQGGNVTGTPTATGTYSFQVQVTDSDAQQPQTAVRQLSVSITGAPLLLVLSSEAVPDGRVGTAYQYALRYAPNSGVTWKLKSGVLPGGMSFVTGTGTLSGTPTGMGSYTFIINVTDGLLGNIDRTFTLTVY